MRTNICVKHLRPRLLFLSVVLICTVNSVHCTQSTVHCTFYSVHLTLECPNYTTCDDITFTIHFLVPFQKVDREICLCQAHLDHKRLLLVSCSVSVVVIQ